MDWETILRLDRSNDKLSSILVCDRFWGVKRKISDLRGLGSEFGVLERCGLLLRCAFCSFLFIHDFLNFELGLARFDAEKANWELMGMRLAGQMSSWAHPR